MQVNIKHLVDDVQCYQTVRELRWPDGVACPSCESKHVIKRGFDQGLDGLLLHVARRLMTT